MYIHQNRNWTDFSWDAGALESLLGNTRNLQGKLCGKMESLGFQLKEEAFLQTLTLDVLKSSEIEGEQLDREMVRSSIAKKLGMEIAAMKPSDRFTDGVVEMMVDATQNFKEPLSKERLCGWHAALFPTGRSGIHKIVTGDWRKAEGVPMQVVSGPAGREKIHFEAPPSSAVPYEMKRFIGWFNRRSNLDPVIRAGIAHLWFISIHPFNDGNGRIARAITDMQLARSDRSRQRFYSMSAQIRTERKQYYEILEQTQKGTSDITLWLKWFLSCLERALNSTEQTLERILIKAQTWEHLRLHILNERQKIMINKLLDGFEGNLTTSKWAKICNCSPDTALRDIQDLLARDIFEQAPAGGRSTNYGLKDVRVDRKGRS
jgi:Fic family protein